MDLQRHLDLITARQRLYIQDCRDKDSVYEELSNLCIADITEFLQEVVRDLSLSLDSAYIHTFALAHIDLFKAQAVAYKLLGRKFPFDEDEDEYEDKD